MAGPPLSDAEQRARAEAFRDGWKAAEVNNTLASHQQRLDMLNGNIARGADETRALRELVEQLLAHQKERDAVQAALAQSLKESRQEAQVSRQESASSKGLWLAAAAVVVGVLLPLLTAFIASGRL